MYRLLQYTTWFGKPTAVKRVMHYNVSPSNAFQICKNYESFLRVMLADDEGPFDLKWIKGGPGEVGGTVEYGLKRDGMYNIIKEEIIEIASNEKTDVHRITWTNVGSDPWLPMVGYKSHFELKPPTYPDPSSSSSSPEPLCQMTWTQEFKSPWLLGIVPYSGLIKRSLNGTGSMIANFTFRQYYAQEFPTGGKSLPKKGDRVAIVGAGPSGLHMAHVLKKKLGIKDITILERSDRFGGKTVTVDDQTNPGVVHELGTCYMHPAYFAVRAYMQELKEMILAKGQQPPKGFAEEVEPITYSIESAGKANCSLDDWVISNLKNQKPMLNIMSLFRIVLPTVDAALELFYAKSKYNRLHNEIFGAYDFSLPPRLSSESLAKIDMSFGQFLEEHGLTAMNPILAYGNTAQGYGTIENVPAFWAMCWITPELLDGYFRFPRQIPPKKAMFTTGWRTMWEATTSVNDLNIEYNTDIHSIERNGVGSSDNLTGRVTITGEKDGEDFERDFDYLVVAAPLHNPKYLVDDEWSTRDGIKDKLVPLELTDEEEAVLRSEYLTVSQFRTLLFKLNEPRPYLWAHLEMNSDKLLGAGSGGANIFASRDSYLALNPEYCTFKGHKTDPLQYGLREQMAYQWAENDRHLTLKAFNEKFEEWSRSKLGTYDCHYEILKEQHWNYFMRYNQNGLREAMPWKILELQGKHNTMFVHASTFFESVLDIINYNNMIVDGLSGKLNSLTSPPRFTYRPVGTLGAIPDSERVPLSWLRKPFFYETDHYKIMYNRLTRLFLRGLNLVFNSAWALAYIPLYPILSLFLSRRQRYMTQKQFRTPNIGRRWWTYTMSKFLAVSPSVICYINESENRKNGNNNLDTLDPVIRVTQEDFYREYPHIGRVNKAMMLSYADYRALMPIWFRNVQPTWLSFIGPRTVRAFKWLSYNFPIVYNYAVSWLCIFAFNFLTGFGIRVEDEKGGGCYIPHCHMLDVSRKEYGEEMASKICTHVCKIMTEEMMRRKGLPVVLEPDFINGSCMVRPTTPRTIAYRDHSLFRGMEVLPETRNPAYTPTPIN